MRKALTPRARINPSRCLSFNTSFFVVVYTQMKILGARSRPKKRTRGEMNHRAKMKIKGWKRMRKMRLKAMAVIKTTGKIKVCRSLSLKSRLFVFSGNVMDGTQAKRCNRAFL